MEAPLRPYRLFPFSRSRSAARRSTCSNIFVITPANTDSSDDKSRNIAIVFHNDPFPGNPIW